MSEIKTCEQYVLRELENTQHALDGTLAKLEDALDENDAKRVQIEELESLNEKLIDYVEFFLNRATKDGSCVDFKNLWEWNEKEAFDKFEEILADIELLNGVEINNDVEIE